MSDPKRIAIIGGGVSGLAAAYRLRELQPDAEVTLFESANRLGGVIRTEEIDGFRLEYGPDSLLTQVPWGLELCRRIGLANDIIPTAAKPQGVYVVCRGRLQKVPSGLALMAPQRIWPLIASPILSVRGKLRLAGEYFVPARQDTSDESLAAFVSRRLGREAFERIVQPLVSGIFMGSPDALSVQATFPRFVEMEQKYGGLIRGARAGTGKPETAQAAKAGGPAYGMFVAPRHGMEQITQALAGSLPPESIRLSTVVEQIVRESDGRWRIASRAAGAPSESEVFDALIVAAPAPAAARLLNAAAPSLAAELAAIDHTSCVVVNIAFARDQIGDPLDAFGFVTPLIERREVTACTFSSIKYPGRAPDGQCLLRAYLGGAANPAAIDWTDHAVKRAALDDLNQLLRIRGEPTLFTISRHRRTMPQYELGHVARVDQIEKLVARLPGLALAGNAYRGGGVAHCIHSGELAAQQIAEHLHQPAAELARS